MLEIWKNLTFVSLFNAVFVFNPAAASATPNTDFLAVAFSGETTDYKVLTDKELSEARGGLRSFSFGLFINGDITNFGSDVPEGVDIISQSPDLVSLSVGLAGLTDTGGLIQFASIVGDNNIINNNIFLNIYIMDDGVADTSNLFSGSIGG